MLGTLISCLLAVLVFDTSGWDFGVVKEAGGTVGHSFVIANSSKHPLKISSVSASCTCVSARWPQEAIPAGKTAELSVSFNPSGYSGLVSRHLTIWGEGGESLGALEIKAEVVPAGSVGERAVLCASLATSVKQVRFGYIPRGTSATRICTLRNVSGRPIALSSTILRSSSGRLSIVCPPSLEAGETAELLFVYTMPSGPEALAVLSDSVVVRADKCSEVLGIGIEGICIEPLNKGKKVPSMWTSPSEVLLKRGAGSFVIGNRGSGNLRILSVQKPAGVAADLVPCVKKSGETLKVKVESSDLKSFSIYIFTDDPLRPCREIRFKTS